MVESAGRSAIVVVVDRWGAGYLGPYGNTWLDTPALNKFASESFLCEHAIIDSPNLDGIYGSYWSARHALCPRSADPAMTWVSRLVDRRLDSVLVTDDPRVAQHPLAASFDSCQLVVPTESDVAQTGFESLFSAAAATIQEAMAPGLVWVHSRGMSSAWDAPLELRRQFAGDDDPLPPDSLAVPCELLDEDFDPDHLLGIVQSYAGQVALFDVCWSAFQAAVELCPLANGALWALTSSRGFPLGEHRRVGAYDDALHTELVHVPWMLRFPNESGAGMRSQALVQPADMGATVDEWLTGERRGASHGGLSLMDAVRSEGLAPTREYACITADSQQAVRTPHWFWRRQLADRDEPDLQELYVKPDDRWEVNEIADRCLDQVASLQVAFNQFAGAAADECLHKLPGLDAELQVDS